MSQARRAFEYTAREFGFIRLAALQSGYFTRRHFNLYVGRECGAIGQQFIDRALRLGHIRVLTGFGRQHLCHVHARGIYARLGDPANRNRREHGPETIRLRLMALDYVLDRPHENWLLGTEACREALNIGGTREREGFPADRHPISVADEGSLEFGFVDPGFGGFSQWERYLDAHRSFLRTRKARSMTYASCEASRFVNAEKVYRRMVGESSAGGGIDRARLQGYFAARRLVEDRRFENFDKLGLDRLREDQRAYAGDEFEALYRRWREGGDDVLGSAVARAAEFRTKFLPLTYAWLSPIRFQGKEGPRWP
jgi:hypothetical protein